MGAALLEMGNSMLRCVLGLGYPPVRPRQSLGFALCSNRVRFRFLLQQISGLKLFRLGELMVGFNFGPLIVLSAYFVQTGRISLLPVIVSIPIGLLVAAVLYINQFPDFEADRAVKKDNLVVRLGLRRTATILFIAGNCLSGGRCRDSLPGPPTAALAVFLTIPWQEQQLIRLLNGMISLQRYCLQMLTLLPSPLG